ncbi:MAG TPA: GDSL-type esterase/lipase family protein, partial [Actinomycetota bacterium]
MATTDTDHTTPPSKPSPEGRHTMPAGKVLIAMLVCLLVWALLYAPTLKRASEAQPLGTRRTVSLWVLGPLAAISNVLQLTTLTDGVSSALGKDPDAAAGGDIGDIVVPSIAPGASLSPTPQGPVTQTTPIRKPTPKDKLRVVVVGDSLSQGLGVYMEREFQPSLVRVSKQGRISTGLARLDYFDWLGGMKEIEEGYRPDLVIVMIGDNDNQSLQTPGGQTAAEIGSYEWPRGYEERVEEMTRIAVDGGAHVAWVGLPIVSKKDRWPVMRRQNEIFERVIERTPNAVYIDTWDRFATPGGDYTDFYRHDGQAELIRATDGLHFNPRGYELVAQAVTDA